jgi:predicted GTPase
MHWRKALCAALPARVQEDRLQAVAEVTDAHNGIDTCGDGKRQRNAQEELHLVDEQGLGQQAVSVEDNEPADDVCDLAQSQDLIVCELAGWSLVGWWEERV